MHFSIKISVAALMSSLVISCGILEQSSGSSSGSAPEPSAVSLPTPTVAPLISTSGKLVTAGGDSPGTVQSNSKIVADSNQPQPNQSPANQSLVTAAPENSVESVVNIFQTDRCNALSRGGFIWFTDEVVLNDWLSPLDDEEAKQVVARIDFSKQGALLLDYGIAGSKGAGATIVDNKVEIKGDEAIVRVKQFNAPKNKKTVQVVTHPCSLFVMPRTGFSKLVVLSDLDDKLTSFDNK